MVFSSTRTFRQDSQYVTRRLLYRSFDTTVAKLRFLFHFYFWDLNVARKRNQLLLWSALSKLSTCSSVLVPLDVIPLTTYIFFFWVNCKIVVIVCLTVIVCRIEQRSQAILRWTTTSRRPGIWAIQDEVW